MPERTDTAEATGASIPRAEIAVFAHELRGALTVIAGYGDMLRRPLDEAERLQALDGIRRAVSRADSLCSDVLAGRRAGGADVERREPLDVAELVTHVAEEQRAATGRTILAETAAGLRVIGDGAALARILTNLITNAAKYSPAETTVDVRAWRDDTFEFVPTVVIEVSDRGPGIPPEERERLFSPFQRLERDADIPGTGLGLSVVRDVAEAHGGDAVIREREGGGTTVRVELPAA